MKRTDWKDVVDTLLLFCLVSILLFAFYLGSLQKPPSNLIIIAVVAILALFFFRVFYLEVSESSEAYETRAGESDKQKILEENLSPTREKACIAESQEYVTITGQLTLLGVEKVTGIPARKIADGLGLPLHISLDETLGRLRKRYPFTMSEARGVVSSLQTKRYMENL